jgi:tetratricopeptide (TPR) repeat protein
MSGDDMQGKPHKKYPFYFYLIAVLIPILFFLALEGVLRLFNYGDEIQEWVATSEKFSDYIQLNPDIAKRYFHTLKNYPTPHFDGFHKVKPENDFRVFIMGGSTAAGFPYPMNGAFSRYVKRYLSLRYPGVEIEVINLAISAINSYTLRDLMPGIIAQRPDLILIYAGHNEYYGALGAGSSQFWGSSRAIVNLLLDAKNIRIVQLLRNIIISIRGWFASTPVSPKDATLMEGMVGQQLIPLYSSVYENGLAQFEGNMRDVIEIAREAGIPVIISTMTCNLRDQAPFESARKDSLPAAADVFKAAVDSLQKGLAGAAAPLFMRAKELDLLRFRAPEAINSIIRKLALDYRLPLIDMNSVFTRHSEYGIVGGELMTDHVHPNISGIELMGRAFASAMEASHLVPAGAAGELTVAVAEDSAARTNTMTRLDSVYGMLRINYLKGGWPFKKAGEPNTTLRDFKPADRVEELALDLFREKIHWGEAHIRAGLWYKDQGNLDQFERELLALHEVMPFNDIPLKILTDGFIEFDRLDRAFVYLQKLEQLTHSAYAAKWIGLFFLVHNDFESAGRYLELSIARDDQDPQVFYNLAGVYIHHGEYQKALDAINRCLGLDPRFEGAARTKADLMRALEVTGG